MSDPRYYAQGNTDQLKLDIAIRVNDTASAYGALMTILRRPKKNMSRDVPTNAYLPIRNFYDQFCALYVQTCLYIPKKEDARLKAVENEIDKYRFYKDPGNLLKRYREYQKLLKFSGLIEIGRSEPGFGDKM